MQMKHISKQENIIKYLFQVRIKKTLDFFIFCQQFSFIINLNKNTMMNMKKLIDETDFDNLAELTKRWGNSTHKPTATVASKQQQKQNDSKKSNEMHSRSQVEVKLGQTQEHVIQPIIKQTQPRKKQVMPQVIDQDTEHFKNKLEHLLNNFKTDAVAEFMNMKREMLDYQQECVKSDTQKYLTMYEEKHKELLETKQKLLQVSRQAEKKTRQVQLLSDHIANLNERMKTFKYVSRPFSILYENKVRGSQLKFKMKQAAKFDQKRLKRKSIWGWMSIYKTEKNEKQKTINEQRIEKEVSDIVGKFQKQMDTLKQRLAESTRKNQEYESNKHILQQNLKKAFLRGVCAMNMEAMGVLGSQNMQQVEWNSQKQKTQREKSIIANNLSYVEPKTSIITRQDINQNQSMYVQKPSASRLSNPSISEQRSEPIIMNSHKAESKNLKWKQAPIMGVQEVRDQQQPRMQVVRPTTEGKVIKVVEGKSSVEVKKIIPEKNVVGNSSRKKV